MMNNKWGQPALKSHNPLVNKVSDKDSTRQWMFVWWTAFQSWHSTFFFKL